MIAFLDRDKNKQVNFVRLPKDGELSGQVTSLNAPEGTEEVRQLAGWAPDNKIGVLLTSKQKFALYTLPAKGGQAAIVLNNYFAVQPRWSPDRSKIFYVTPEGERPQWAYGLVMASVPAIGGSGKLLIKNQDVKVIHPFAPQAGIRVSPDGKTIVLAGWTSGDTVFGSLPATRIWKLSSDGLKSEKITNEEGSFVDLSPSWSPDGQKIAFLRYRIKEVIGSNIKYEKTSIYIINSSGGEPELLVEPDNFLLLSVWSPDGKMIAYISKGEEAKFFLNVINVDNGAVTVLYEIPSFTPTLDPCWSPDSKRIAFNDGKVIKIINLNDGSSEDIKTNLTDDGYIFYLDWSHDGEQFVFGGWKGGNPEFWFLQDFLPLEKMVQKNETVKLE
jgi:Tol biopolymer transport system component